MGVSHLVAGLQVSPVLHQTLHNVHKAPGGGRQHRTLALAVFGVHVAAGLAECQRHGRVTVPGGAVQRRLLLLLGETEERKQQRFLPVRARSVRLVLMGRSGATATTHPVGQVRVGLDAAQVANHVHVPVASCHVKSRFSRLKRAGSIRSTSEIEKFE